MSEPLLDIRGLKTYFYTEDGVVKAVDEVDLGVGKGTVLGLVGESGCGKSTLALSILRLVSKPGRVVGGEILFEGRDLLKMDAGELRRIRGGEISMIFQDPMSSLNPVFKVGDQIGEAVRIHQEIDAEDEVTRRVADILKEVGISEAERRASHYPHEFSGGMRQRVMIAMALSCHPKLLIADEPTTSLDVTVQAQIVELLRELRRRLGSSILLITHNLGLVAELSDLVAVMYAGKVVEYADVLTIFKKARHPYTRALLESIPRVDVKRKALKAIPGAVPSLIGPGGGCRFAPRCRYGVEGCKEAEPPKIQIGPGHVVYCLRAQELDFERERSP